MQRYLTCAPCCTAITHPILVGWPIFKERALPVLEERRPAVHRMMRSRLAQRANSFVQSRDAVIASEPSSQ
jgi:hypothetical protein